MVRKLGSAAVLTAALAFTVNPTGLIADQHKNQMQGVSLEVYRLEMDSEATRHYFPTGISATEHPIAAVVYSEVYCPKVRFNHALDVNAVRHQGEWTVTLRLADDGCEEAYVSLLVFDAGLAAVPATTWKFDFSEASEMSQM